MSRAAVIPHKIITHAVNYKIIICTSYMYITREFFVEA